MSYIEKGKATSQLVTGGRRKGSKGWFIEPSLFADPPTDSPIWREEIFGPVLTVKRFKSEAEAIALANETAYGLAGKYRKTIYWAHTVC
jgi:aldehyde dehydrogenase (NAD+)